MRRPLIILIVLFSVAAGLAARDQPLPDGLYAEIRTEKGTIVCTLEFEKAPMTVSNFVGLAEGTLRANGAAGRRFFDGLTFHRVIKDFMIQSGDPKGDGSGGPGYEFPNEVRPDLKHDSPGVLAMANAGPDTNGSQFYITRKAAPWLDGGYSVFGRVVRGQEVVNAIQQGNRIVSVRILRVGAKAGAFMVTQKGFDAVVAKARAAAEQRKKQDRQAALALIRKQWPNLVTTRSGLMYEVLKKGSGGSPSMSSTVTVRYVGKLLDGSVFDSTEARGSPAIFEVNVVGRASAVACPLAPRFHDDHRRAAGTGDVLGKAHREHAAPAALRGAQNDEVGLRGRGQYLAARILG